MSPARLPLLSEAPNLAHTTPDVAQTPLSNANVASQQSDPSAPLDEAFTSLPFPADKLTQLLHRRQAQTSSREDYLTADEGYNGTSADDDETSADELSVRGLPSFSALSRDLSTTTDKPTRKRPADNSSPRVRKRRKKGTGKRGGWSKGKRLGPRPAVEPSLEFNDLHKQATNAFIDDQDNEKALALILRAIAINPEIYAAHALLSEIYFDSGDEEKAIAALFSGAHSAARDPEVWQQVADACLQRTSGDRQTALQQACYCYSRILHNYKDNDVRFRRAAANRELGNYAKALKDLEVILKHMPNNSDVLRQVAEICIETRELDRARSWYEASLSSQQDAPPATNEDAFNWADILVYAQILALQEPPDVALSEAIKTIKRLSRWLLGRQAETFWDTFTDDDREWDSEDDPRRVTVDAYTPGTYPIDAYGSGLPLELRARLGVHRLRQGPHMLDEALAHFDWLEVDVDPEDEAANVNEYPDLFLDVGQALQEAKEYNQALRYFEALRDVNAYSDAEFWLGIAANSYLCGNKAQAIDCYEEAKAADDKCIEARTQLSKLYADLGDKEKAMENAREAVLLAETIFRKPDKRKYERKDQRLAREEAEKALKEAYKLPGSVNHRPPVSSVEVRLQRGTRARRESKPVVPRVRRKPKPRPKRMTAEERESRRTEAINRLYNSLLENTEAMRRGEEMGRNIWMDCADDLIADFRSNRVFYPAERGRLFTGYGHETRNATPQEVGGQPPGPSPDGQDQDMPMPSVESDVPTEYRDIHFDDWLDVFLEYALVLANSGEPDAQSRCYTVITAALDCAVYYHNPRSLFHIYVTYFTCALALGDAQTLFNVVLRWFIRTFHFCTDGYRLFSAINYLYPHANDKSGKDSQMANAVFRSGPSQKFMFRQVMHLDLHLPEDYHAEGFGPVPPFMRQANDKPRKGQADEAAAAAGQDEDMVTPKEMDVVLLTLYGHFLYAGGSFPNALSYFFRAQSIDPKNPVILLSIALSYLHELLKRQNEDRHMFLLQGWAFFEQYADARRERATLSGDEDAILLSEREIAYNRARCWHMLGMADLAVRAYEKMLSMTTSSEGESAQYGDLTREAAYAVQTMYALSGNPRMARVVTEKYLVV